MKAISAEDFCLISSVSDVAFSPSGKNACFVLTKADKAKNTYLSYIYSLKDGKAKKLTGGGKERRFQFLDDETLLFPVMR